MIFSSIRLIKIVLRKVLNFFHLDLIRKRDRNFDKIILECFHAINEIPQIVVDVGAHNGSSIERFNSLFDKPKIYSFEANPKLAISLAERYEGTKVEVFNMGVGSTKGRLPFNVHNTSSGSSSFLEFNPTQKFSTRRDLNWQTVEKVIVEVTTLDLNFYTKELNQTVIDYLKIDTQGTELDVLRGARNLLENSQIKFIELEIMTTPAYLNKENWSHVIDYLLSLNYHLVALSNDQRFFNLGAFDILKNPELQFDCIFSNDKIYTKLLRIHSNEKV
jgi:FkbM family methyltransferase